MSEPSSPPARKPRPLASLRAHPLLALGMLLLVLVLGIPMAWTKGEPRYMADSTIQVAPRYMRNLKEDQELDFQSNTQYRQFVEHQRRSVGRHDVLRDALARLGERRHLWQEPGESERRAIDRLREQLQVASVPDTYLLRLSLEGPRPDGLAEVVNAVTSTFIERMKSEEIYGADERTRALRERESELMGLIEARSTRRSEIARELGLTTFNEGTPNPYDRLLADLRGRLSEARQRRVDAEAALAAFRQRGDTHITVRSVNDAVLNDPGLNGLKGALSTRRAALLTQRSGLRADHPGAEAVDRELAEIDAELRRQTGTLEGAVRANVQARLQGTVDQAAAVERDLEVEQARLQAQATGFATLFHEARTLTADMDQARLALDKVRERVDFIDLERSSFGFLRLVNGALVPERPHGPGRRKLLLMVLLAALAAAVAVPVVVDLLDRRVRTVGDAQNAFGVEPAGWQVERSDAASGVFADEQLRRIGAALIRSRDLQQRRVFGFTGCKPGAGTTTLMGELAGALQSLGYRVLRVDAHGRGDGHRGASGRPGLAELLLGTADAQAVVEDHGADAPATVQASSGPGVLRIVRLDRFAAALEAWSERYDFVLVDLPPLLTSADAELLARSVGQVMVVADAGGVTRGELRRASRMLQAIDPSAVGLVVNRIAPFDGGYLRELMLESLAGMRSDRFFTMSRWRLVMASWMLRLRRARH